MKSISKQNSVRRVNRGITLLMVLALMTMFSMLVVTFMLVTSSAKIMAVRHAQALLDPKDREPKSLTDESEKILESIIFGGDNSRFGLSILENLYGNGAFGFTITPGSSYVVDAVNSNKRIIYLRDTPQFKYPATGLHRFGLGHVLTLVGFTIGTNPITNEKYILTQAEENIVNRYKPESKLIYTYGDGVDASGSYSYFLFDEFSNTDVADFALLNGKGTWQFIINSPAFSGTGEGFDPAKKPNEPALSVNINGIPRVFLPNLPDYGSGVMMNPDYTAPDHLTWFLAWYDLNDDGTIKSIIPSYHRPQIIKSYRSILEIPDTGHNDSEGNPDPYWLLRAATLRPLPIDHPKFTGSNTDPKASSTTPTALVDFLINGQLDVDNDNDGVKDSIWIDIGLDEVDQGRDAADVKVAKTKPLVAVLIRDLDGLLNVNAHGSEAHLAANFSTPATSSIDAVGGAYNMGKRGAGIGPAEVRLDLVLGQPLFNAFLTRRSTTSYTGDTAWVESKYYSSHNGNDGEGRLYPDFWGFAPVVFEPLGYKFFDLANYNSSSNLYQNNPYLADIYSGDSTQFLFAELEPFLRSQNDIDSGQFDNDLKNLFANNGANFDQLRRFITTQSSDIPSPARSGGNDSNGTYASLLERIFRYAEPTSPTPPTPTPHYDAIVKNMSPEIIKGEKINLAKISGASTAKKSEIAHQIFLLLMVLCYDKIDNGYTEPGLEDPTPDPAKTKERIITRLAQWSVNLVDFIDTDSTMTPMIFSIEPFTDTYLDNGYAYSFDMFKGDPGDPGDSTANPPRPPRSTRPPVDLDTLGIDPPGPSVTNMRVVFGKEDNDLFITKTFATHNRNTADSRKDNTTTCTVSGCSNRCLGYVDATCTGTHDQDFDQIFRPEGSLFVELYRQGDPTRWRSPNDLYETDNKLNLAKVNSVGEPVWRIMIGKEAKDKPNNTSKVDNSVVQELTTKGKTYSFQPRQWNDSSKVSAPNFIGDCNVEPERYMFFVEEPKFKTIFDYNNAVGFGGTGAAVDADIKERSFVNIGGFTLAPNASPSSAFHAEHAVANTILKPNEFFMIAPRVVTSFASQEVDEESATPTSPLVSAFGIPKENPDPTEYTPSAAAREHSVDLRQFDGNLRVKTMVAAIPSSVLEVASGVNNWKDRLTLGYITSALADDIGASGHTGIGINVSEPLPTTTNFTANKYYAIPASLDANHKESYVTSSNFDDPTYAIDNDFVKGFGTIAGFRSLFLQRLADPNRQYHPQNNPYITVDWSMVDLHVFSSEKVKKDANNSDLDDEFAAKTGDDEKKFDNDKLYFGIREWGTTAAKDDHRSGTKRPNIRSRAFEATEVDDKSKLENEIALSDIYDPDNLKLLTTGDVPKWGELSYKYGAKLPAGATTPPGNNLLNPSGGSWHPDEDFAGVPDKGFLHFPWHDSPLASTFELMLVPAVSASRFGYDCYYDHILDSSGAQRTAQSLGCDGNAQIRNKDSNTGLYLNFYSASGSLDLVRLFEYVRVPSRFKSTVDGSGNDALSKMREPGKINLNTMNKKSWIALGGSAAEYDAIDANRRSIVSGAYTGRTEFANPFRSPHAANMVPDMSMLRQPVKTTLLDISDPNDSSGFNIMQPKNDTSKPESYNHYTSLHHVMRLSEMTTTRSNVFAIWVTTGYFKVEDDDTLGAEVGIDDGTVERHRDFYIVDRSKPVGFQRGQKLNSNQIILHKKSLE